MNDWYKRSWRRCIIDMHIGDSDDRYLSKLDVNRYVDMFRLNKVDSVIVIAQAMTGLCYYPTKYGEMHKTLNGRDILGEAIRSCREQNLNIVLYYTLIFDNWAFYNHPEWRIITADGKELDEKLFGRTKVVCPNNPEYRELVVKRVTEVASRYDFDGIRFDMTFWPHICYCKHCLDKYAGETGGEPPRVVDWQNPEWVRFQRTRERWINEFAQMATSLVRTIKPDVTVEHQSSTYTFSWKEGITSDFSKSSDLLEGDFYGGHAGGSFACKLFYNLSDHWPFCYETSSGVSLQDHMTIKSKALLETKVSMALANGGAFLFIDAIDPVGTFRHEVHATMGDIFKNTEKYLPYLGGELCQEAAIYFSTESKMTFDDNGKPVMKASGKSPHLDALMQTTGALIRHNIPFGVVTKKNIHDLSKYKVLILPNVLMMDDEECAGIRAYVKAGGKIYASKFTSLTTKDGNRLDNFMLSDVFGASYEGETAESFTYIGGIGNGSELLGGSTTEYPLSLYSSQLTVRASDDADILAKTVLPFVHPKEHRFIASILNHPPGNATDYDAAILNRYGQGLSLYMAGDLENSEFHEETFAGLIRFLAGEPFTVESNAPKPVELTTFHQPNRSRYIVNMLNFQDPMPNLPVYDINVRLRIMDRSIKSVLSITDGIELNFSATGGFAEFTVPKLETYQMIEVRY
ncbi:beta-galactosidase trimerization domain-containing protein [Paenibacillus montanisoli]|uniref:Beta-galactosidase trimerisation domain-containing protein n=1 Tax=Paenibacillus montanisoli TaxID=2081970 RepID=A0A328U8L3_9BACL|nr:beta-galactosidase trimerization domain-containing protein [Paenibacillus montanisoli]RAP78412.1 hypothetical protein DL346_08305 [Paenibacillus montanisoli]